MNIETSTITPESPQDYDAVEKLAADAFGPGRFARSAFRLRESMPHEQSLSFTLYYEGELAGSVRLTKIIIGGDEALLLGPLVVAGKFKNFGVGRKLMQKAVEAAREEGHSCIILVGDLPYYQRFGFEKIKHGQITLPGPADPDRILICALKDGAADAFSGAAIPYSQSG